jgi:GNAT superfamily N-acetyltransferase
MDVEPGPTSARSRFEIRRAEDEDRDGLLSLIGKLYSGDSIARYEHLYRSNPHGAALTWLAIETTSGEAVACTSLFPRRVHVAGRQRVGSIGGDCYVEPRVRRQGLAVALHRASLAEMREGGVDFMYGPPVPNNLAALLKAGSTLVGEYRRWVRPLNSRASICGTLSRGPRSLVARVIGVPLRVLDRMGRSSLRGFSIDEIVRFDAEFDELFDRVAPTHTIAGVRDSGYLTWRYAAPRRQVPLAVRHHNKLVGLVVIEMDQERAALVDVFTSTDAASTDVALRLAMEYAVARGCYSIEVNATERSPVARRLARFGYISRDARGFQVAVSPLDEQVNVLVAAPAWHLMEADKDLDTVFLPAAQKLE